jgi:predicted dehydrogenase
LAAEEDSMESEINRRAFMRRAAGGAGAAFVLNNTAEGLAEAGPAAPSDRITVGVIGTGARAQELMQAVMDTPGTQIVAACDAYRGRLTRTQERTKGSAKIYKDHREILADKGIDVVVVATPDHWHKTMVVEAMQAGKDVYCEKPLTYTVQEGNEIIAAVKKTGRILQVGSQGMSSMIQRKAKEIIASGKLGQVTLLRAFYNRNTASGAWIYPIPPDATPQTVNWDMFLGPAPKRAFSLERFFRWRCYADYSGGIATDLFVHLCTTIHFLMGAKMPGNVVAAGALYRWKESRDVPDTINAILEYPEGFTVSLSSTFNNQMSSEASFQILGTKGSLLLGFDELTFIPENVNEDNRWIVESWPTAMEEAYYKDPKVKKEEVPASREPKVLGGTETYREEGVGATVLHFRNFFRSVRERTQPEQDALAGHRAASCAHLVNLSVKQKRAVQWDFSRETVKA